jgi:hypothetical protein
LGFRVLMARRGNGCRDGEHRDHERGQQAIRGSTDHISVLDPPGLS